MSGFTLYVVQSVSFDKCFDNVNQISTITVLYTVSSLPLKCPLLHLFTSTPLLPNPWQPLISLLSRSFASSGMS